MNLEPGAGQINGDFIEMSGFEMDEAAEDNEPAAAAAPASDDAVSESSSSVDLMISECYNAVSAGQGLIITTYK